MNSKKRISAARKQSRIVTSKRNIWFYSEANDSDRTPILERKSFENDWQSILKQDNSNALIGEPIKNSNKEDCPFVVDWQMSDSF